MSAFLVSKRDSDDLETIVFTLDDVEGDDQGVPVFSSENSARAWLAGSEFETDFDVVVVDDLPFMIWCADICREGIGHLILNPDRSTQEVGEGQNVIDLSRHFEWSANHLLVSDQKK